nr:MAG TPA: minor structural protein [Bacteriophage sp.]
MGIEDEKIDEIITMHTETVDGLKADVAKYKADAETLPEVQRQLEKAQNDLEAGKKDSWKVKYEAVKEEFEGYKSEQTKKETRAAKEKAYRELLKQAGVSEKRLDTVLRVSDVDGVELDDKGAVKGSDKLVEGIKSEWADFITTTSTKGADTANPPANRGGNAMTRDEIFKIKDATARQAAIKENINLFQKGVDD